MSGSILNSVLKFINFWYLRYLMTTELYMMERWERVSIHIFLFMLFMVQWVFNYGVLLPFTAKVLDIQLMTADSLKVMT